jgi:hypothetical protein
MFSDVLDMLKMKNPNFLEEFFSTYEENKEAWSEILHIRRYKINLPNSNLDTVTRRIVKIKRDSTQP